MPADSLIQRLQTNAKNLPNKVALTFLGSGPNGGVIENSYTFREIQERTDELAKALLNAGLKRGELAVLVLAPSLEFILAFMACLKAGIVAVPVFPPNPSRKDTLVMFTKIIQACGATFVLTSASYNHMKKFASLKDALLRFQKSSGNAAAAWPDNLTWIVLDHLPGGGSGTKSSVKHDDVGEDIKIGENLPSDLAFLQFTSGSTSLPKGVMITHHNLADNLFKITSELKAEEDTVVVSWLPQYHDMGLIGSYLGILYCGGSGYYMSPLTYLQRPAMWIEAISKYRGTHLQAPNFAFQLTARKFKESTHRKDNRNDDSPIIDLSCVRHIINAAEPVTEDSIESFCSVFCPLGLDRNVIYPTYGLAEHTVFVCSGGKQRLTVSKKALEVDGVVKIMASSSDKDTYTTHTAETSRLIGCGYPANQNVNVQIVHTETFQALGEDLVGEIWIQSESKAAGYYRMPFETRRDFCAMIGNVPEEEEENVETTRDDFVDNDNKPRSATIDTSQGYLRTGDLGFLHNGELFICGRIKDLIIVGGRNYYPQDIEATAEASDTRFRPGCSAAFTVDPISADNEQVALVLELRDVPKASVSTKIHYHSGALHKILDPVYVVLILNSSSLHTHCIVICNLNRQWKTPVCKWSKLYERQSTKNILSHYHTLYSYAPVPFPKPPVGKSPVPAPAKHSYKTNSPSFTRKHSVVVPTRTIAMANLSPLKSTKVTPPGHL